MGTYRRSNNSNPIRLYTFVFCVTLITLFFVWTRLQNIRLQREIAKLTKEEHKLRSQNKKLRLQWASLTSPERLEKIGVKKYKLRSPRVDQVIILRDSQQEGLER